MVNCPSRILDRIKPSKNLEKTRPNNQLKRPAGWV